MKPAGFHVLVATDGSKEGRAAVAVTTLFPWPRGAVVHGLVARGVELGPAWPPTIWDALDRSLDRIARGTRRVLARRWPDPDVAIVDRPPVDAILARARALGAWIIVLGSRGHGMLARFILGSVSRGVVRRAACPVLVVRGRPRQIRHLVVGLDGSPNAARGVDFVAALEPGPEGRVTLVRAVEPTRLPSMALLPASIRAELQGHASALIERELAAARREVETAARQLQRAGWTVETVVRHGPPLPGLLDVVTASRADCLALGARGIGGVERLLLGSVSEGALSRSPVPVLIVK